MQYVDILTSTLFSGPAYQTYGGMIARGEFEPAGFSAALGLKDIRLALAAADELAVPLPLASLLRDRFLALVANGGGQLDWSAIATLAGRDAGGGSPAESHNPPNPSAPRVQSSRRRRPYLRLLVAACETTGRCPEMWCITGLKSIAAQTIYARCACSTGSPMNPVRGGLALRSRCSLHRGPRFAVTLRPARRAC